MSSTKKNLSENEKTTFDFAFEKINYILMAIGILVMAIGYLLMTGGGSDDFNSFNESLFDFRRLILAPLVILGGIIIEIIAIMKRPKTKK